MPVPTSLRRKPRYDVLYAAATDPAGLDAGLISQMAQAVTMNVQQPDPVTRATYSSAFLTEQDRTLVASVVLRALNAHVLAEGPLQIGHQGWAYEIALAAIYGCAPLIRTTQVSAGGMKVLAEAILTPLEGTTLR